nr:DUF3644 domain-containing protein [Corynebacterium ulcerans]
MCIDIQGHSGTGVAIIRKYGIDEIYYDDGDKTIALTDCLKKVFTNDKDPLRINMAELIRFHMTRHRAVVQTLPRSSGISQASGSFP